jgi:hypothetical protein
VHLTFDQRGEAKEEKQFQNLATLLNYQLEHSRSSGGQILSRTGEIAAPRRSLRPDPRIAGCERGNFKLEHPTRGGDGRYHYLQRTVSGPFISQQCRLRGRFSMSCNSQVVEIFSAPHTQHFVSQFHANWR